MFLLALVVGAVAAFIGIFMEFVDFYRSLCDDDPCPKTDPFPAMSAVFSTIGIIAVPWFILGMAWTNTKTVIKAKRLEDKEDKR